MTQKKDSVEVEDFGYLSRLEVNEQSTHEYTFREVIGKPTIIAKPANQANGEYWSRRVELMTTQEAVERINAQKVGKKKFEDFDREIDRAIYPEVVCVKFGTCPFNSRGERVANTKANLAQFLGLLPDWVFDRFRNVCVVYETFIADVKQLEETEKN